MTALRPPTGPKAKKPTDLSRIVALLVALGFFGLVLSSLTGSDGPPAEAPAAPSGPEPPASGEGPPEANPQPPGPPSPEMMALLDGLKVGDEIEGYKVVAFYPPNPPLNEGVFWVGFDRGGSLFGVSVWGKGKSKRPMPIQTELYEIGYGMRIPPEPYAAEPDMRKAAELVAARVRKREAGMAKLNGF